MKNWEKSDIGKIIVYKRADESKTNRKIAIYDVDPKFHLVGFVDYPITLNSKIYPLGLSSRFGLVSLIKSQEKKKEKYLEKAGDWSFVGRVSEDEKRVLENIVKHPIPYNPKYFIWS